MSSLSISLFNSFAQNASNLYYQMSNISDTRNKEVTFKKTVTSKVNSLVLSKNDYENNRCWKDGKCVIK